MATIKPFKALRPVSELAEATAELPYDVYNREEAKVIVERNPRSFLRIDRPESLLPDDYDTYAPEAYIMARNTFWRDVQTGVYVQDEEPCYYIYELTMQGRVQTGIVALASVDDYLNNVIKKHENTLKAKEKDRIRHIDILSAQTGPIFLAYRAQKAIQEVIARIKMEQTPLFDFVTDDGHGHRGFLIDHEEDITAIQDAFEQAGSVYIADGHHRAASAVHVALERRAAHPDYTGGEEYNSFMAILFPDEELKILDYNRVIRDLNGLSQEAFLHQVSEIFDTAVCEGDPHPAAKGTMSMFLDGTWYTLTVHPEDLSDDPVDGLDVSILQNRLLSPVLGITDPKNDPRIDFVGGIRGLSELEKRCRTDAKAAFAMHPTGIDELFDVADAGRLMPPKSTWFEPKPLSGLFIHPFEL